MARTFVQWNGTDLCMDFYCQCGQNSHVDSCYAYFVKCTKCGQTYRMPADVKPEPVDAGDTDGFDPIDMNPWE